MSPPVCFAGMLFRGGGSKSYLNIMLEYIEFKGAFTRNATQYETKVGKLREWPLTSLAQNWATIQKQFCPSEIKQPLAKFATG